MQKSCGIFLYLSASFLAFVVAGGMGTGKRGDALRFKAPVLPLWPQRCSAPLQGALRHQRPAPRGLGDRGRSRGWLPQRPGSVLPEGNCRARCDAQMRWTQDSAPCVQHRRLSASQRRRRGEGAVSRTAARAASWHWRHDPGCRGCLQPSVPVLSSLWSLPLHLTRVRARAGWL